jgi:hypothetical protein
MEAGRIALHVVASEDAAPILQPIGNVVEVAAASPIVGRSVVGALTEGDEEIAALTAKVEDVRTPPAARSRAIEARSTIIGQKLLTVWNMAAEVVRASRVPAALKGITNAAAQGVTAGVEKGVAKVTSASITGGAAALALHLGQPLLALSFVVETFAPLAKCASGEHEARDDEAD